MGKLDELRRSAVSNIDESMGGGRTEVIPRVSVAGPRSAPARVQGIVKSNDVCLIPVSKIARDPLQPREEFEEDSLNRLAESLRTKGQLQPIQVRWDEASEKYVIVCGERRWRAATLAGLPTLSCVIMDKPATPAELLALALIENLLREDLRPIEQAKGFRALMEANGWSGNQLAKALGVAQPSVVRALALLELPSAVQEQVEQGGLSPSAAYELSKVVDPETQQELAARVVSEGMTRSDVTEAVKKVQLSQGKPRESRGPGGKAAGKAKPKGKPSRLPAEIKHKGSSGVKVVIATAARHTLTDVLSDMEEITARIRAQVEAANASDVEQAA